MLKIWPSICFSGQRLGNMELWEGGIDLLVGYGCLTSMMILVMKMMIVRIHRNWAAYHLSRPISMS